MGGIGNVTSRKVQNVYTLCGVKEPQNTTYALGTLILSETRDDSL
jgi:hypothetical protein